MSDKNLNKAASSNQETEKINKLQDMLSESLLLNTDIFSNEYEEKNIEEDIKEDIEEVEEKFIEEEQALTDQSLKINFANDSFTLTVEENVEETELQKSKREFSESMNKNQNQRNKKKKEKPITLQEKYDPLTHISQSDTNTKLTKKIKVLRANFRDDFDSTREPINQRMERIVKKHNFFNISEMNLGGFQQRKYLRRELSLKKTGKKQDKFSMNFDNIDELTRLVKEENCFKVEIL